MADLQKYYDCGKPTLIQGGWQRAGAGNAYVEFLASTNRISTLDFVPTGHPNNIKVTGIASKTLEVSALVLRNDNYIIEAYGWQANGAEFNVGDSYDKLGIMFRFQDNSDITPSDVEVQELGEWKHSLRKLTTASEIITLPTTIYADGQPISTYSIKGNTTQDGTPTPSNPVAVSGTGDRTENLYNIATVVENTFIKANTTGSPLGSEISNSDWSCSDYIEVSPNTEYTVQYPVYVYAAAAGLVFFTSKSVSSAIEGVTTATQGSKTYTFTTPNNCNYVRFSWGNSKGNETMFVTGGTAKTYEPYGYKIPISSGGVTTNIYTTEPLMKISDSVDSKSNTTETRAIRKYVITGQENVDYTLYSGKNMFSVYNAFDTTRNLSKTGVCSHYIFQWMNDYGYAYIANSCDKIYIFDENYDNASDFKAYLQQQYANGTPVTVWYILATPTTETVTAPSIPTTDGANTITVDTTVQPSEFTATWTGWHDSTVKEWDGTDWQ